ncbi:Retinoic acid induced 16-like protein-domain-containing protein [Myxozyma melibiosi]|uniref:Retinoic acid induced 16-like protein-domain-containing protein n=1 Tax=Myxozyma melibiosi TaxID=54550 RepID=A0ABR1F6Z4_9ASCO
MSFWGIWKRSSAKESVDKGPLALIEKAWIELIRDERLLQDFEGSKAPSKIARDILNISDIISTEERSGNRRVCLQFALDHGLFTKIAEITHLCGLSIIQESVAAFSVLIKSGEEDLMSNDQVIQSINVFLCELYKAKGDRILEDEFSEMLFSVASRLRAEPQSIIKWIRMPENSGENTPIDSHGVGSRHSTYLAPVNERGNNADDEDLPELIYELPNDSSDEISVQDEGSNTEEADHGGQTDTQTTPKASRINNQDAYFAPIDENGSDDLPSTPKAPNGDTVNDETGNNGQAPVKSTEVSSRSSVQQEQYATPEGSPQTNNTPDTPHDANNNDSNESSQNQEDDVEHNINEASLAIDSLLTDLQIDQRRNDFPLFHFLLDFIYHDGKSGEFSRTGIIFIVESAHPGSSLERWILDSDFGTLMASGLGALYSQLSRRLFRAFQSAQEPKIVAVAKESERKYIGSSNDDTAIGPETAEELERNKINLEIFLSYLEFWQDTLSHCKSALIRANLLEKFDTLFLRQLLLPSLVETMDVNNSDLSVAVMTYLRAIFDTLQQKDIVEIILSCLITSDRSETTNGDKEDKSTSQFNMVRMIIDGLDTRSQQTVGSSLRLISSLVRRHYPYVLNTIFSVKSLSESFQPTVTPFNVYAKELEFLLDLLPEGEETSEIESQAYDNYLKESRRIIESHAYLPKSLLSAEMSLSREASDQSRLFKHSMNTDDQTWTRLLRLLSQFFANSVELNLILTRVFIDLASCGWMSLRGWMLVDLENVKSSCERPRRRRGPETRSFGETLNETTAASSELEDDVEKDIDLKLLAEYASDMSYSSSDDDYDEYWGMNSNDRFETTSFTEISPMMEVLSALSKKIESFETKIPNFYDRLAEHRELIRDAEDVIPDVDVSAYSSPVVRQKDIVQRVETRTFSLSPVDTQRRAEELWYSSSSLPSSPAPMRFSSVPSPLTGELRTGVLSRSNTVQRQQRIPSLPPHFSSSPLTLPKRGHVNAIYVQSHWPETFSAGRSRLCHMPLPECKLIAECKAVRCRSEPLLETVRAIRRLSVRVTIPTAMNLTILQPDFQSCGRLDRKGLWKRLSRSCRLLQNVLIQARELILQLRRRAAHCRYLLARSRRLLRLAFYR